MDSPTANQLFKRLFQSPPACQTRRNFAHLARAIRHAHRQYHDHHHRHHPPRIRLLSSAAHALKQSLARSSDWGRGRHGAGRYDTGAWRGGRPVGQQNESNWQQRSTFLGRDLSAAYRAYPTVTAADLRDHRARPREVKMLLRDFVEDSLYNPHYGYFDKVAIFTPGEPFDFPRIRSEPRFHADLSRRYTQFEDALDERDERLLEEDAARRQRELDARIRGQGGEGLAGDDYGHSDDGDDVDTGWTRKGRRAARRRGYNSRDSDAALDAGTGPQEERPWDTRQLWHTPTELFSPWYGYSIGAYLASYYPLPYYQAVGQAHHDLVVYEIGAGRGTLMLNVLDYLRDHHPHIYDRTRYNIIEISGQLASLQAAQLGAAAAQGGHADRVSIVRRSIFDWDRLEPEPCFFLAFEVLDNLAHDAVRYDLDTLRPLQQVVVIDDAGDFYEVWDGRGLDPAAARFLRVREAATGGDYPRPYSIREGGGWANRVRSWWQEGWRRDAPHVIGGGAPGADAGNLSIPEYIPTRLMHLFNVLARMFPKHHLVASDFCTLPGAVSGLNAPVVQTRYKRQPVPVTTPLVHQGYFDIMFPTDFSTARALYQALTSKFATVQSHRDFMMLWADLRATRTRSGENPMLSWYENARVLTTVGP